MSEDLETEYCYRHSSRETYIHCQRCERAICVDCQTPGAVGVLCPECVHPTQASRRRPRVARRTINTPVVTYSIIGVTAFIYFLQWIPGLDVTGALLFAPIYSFGEYGSTAGYEPWRMITTVFVHSTGFILHIGLNMYTLWIFGRILESLLGRSRFLALYLIAGFGGSVGVMYLGDLQGGVVGASGAIFGLMGAFLVIQRRLGGDSTQLLILVGINLVIGFLPGMNVSWQAHVGGLVTGVVLGFVFVRWRSLQHASRQWLATASVAAALVALTVIHAPVFVG